MDSIVENIINRFKRRAEFGELKYGTNLDRKDLSILDWIQHLQDEMHDAYLYSEKLKQDYVLGIKHLMHDWVREEKIENTNMPVELFMASFSAYLSKKINNNNSKLDT
jgi:hypothetical protein